MSNDDERVVPPSIDQKLDTASAMQASAALLHAVESANTSERLQALETDMLGVKEGLQRNTELTTYNTQMTADVHEFITAWRSGFAAIAKFGRGLAMIGRGFVKIVKIGGAVAGGVLAIWLLIQTVLHGGVPPAK